MIPVPELDIIIKDFNLGAGNASLGPPLLLGAASQGTPLQVVTLSQPADALAFGLGTLPETAAYILAAGGGPLYALRAPASLPGTIGAVSSTGTDTLTVTGEPLADLSVQVRITQAGDPAQDTGAFRVSLDGGLTESEDYALVSSYLIAGTGLNLEFSGSYALQTLTFTTAAPQLTLGDLNDALDAALNDRRAWEYVVPLAPLNDEGVALLDVKLEGATNRYRYTFALAQGGLREEGESLAAWETRMLEEYNTEAKRVVLTQGGATVVDVLTGSFNRREALRVVAAKVAATPLAQDPAWVGSGAISGVTDIDLDGFLNPALNNAGFTTLRSIIGLNGYYVTNALTLAPEGSDYKLLQNLRVMNAICTLERRLLLPFLSSSVRVTEQGVIDPRDALRIEGYVNGGLRAAFVAPGTVSSINFSLRRDNNILSDKTFYTKLEAIPLAYGKTIVAYNSFRNPQNEPQVEAEEAA